MRKKTSTKPTTKKAKPTCERARGGCLGDAAEPHECPYAAEINDDHATCTCCANCEQQCSDDI